MAKKENEAAIQELIEFVTRYPSPGLFSHELLGDQEKLQKAMESYLAPATNWVKNRIEYETANGLGTLDDQENWFNSFYYIAFHSSPRQSLIGKLLFSSWTLKTKNKFGNVFALGNQNRKPKAKGIAKTAKATNKRKLIGATSREKVRNAAQSRAGLSKEKASAEIANEINLSSGTVRRYLSELFPGSRLKF